MVHLKTWIAIVTGTMLVSASVQAQTRAVTEPSQQIQQYTGSTAAFKDYMLQCAGCHRFDGAGATHRGIPSFQDSIGLFTYLPAGRDYMIRVPGSSQSQLNNADLAQVLNWIVATFSPDQITSTYKPFTASEVGASRPYRFDDVVPVRKVLQQELEQQGHALAPYLYGHND